MRRLLPHPLASVLLAGTWLALARSPSAAQCVLAVLAAVGIPLALRPLWPSRPILRSWPRALPRIAAYVALVAWDVLRANLQVARAALGPLHRLRPAFVRVPIELEDERAVVVLSHTVGLTPGSLTVEIEPGGRALLVHALDAPDPAALVHTIRERYERRLRGIWAC